MRGIFFDGKVASYREDLEKPIPSSGQSLIRVLYAGICNTDKELLKGYRPDFNGVMGHEFVGIVEMSEQEDLIGQSVVGELNLGCGACIYCRSGREKHCLNRKVLGIHGRDGCFSEYITLENRLIHKIPENITLEEALWIEPLAAAIRIPNQIHMKPTNNIAIIGDGRLAYQIANVLHLQGIKLTVYGKHDEKLEKFKSIAYNTINITSEEQVTDQIDEARSYEVVVEATGSPSGLEFASNIVRNSGTIILKSTYASKLTIDMSYFVVNEITIIGSRCGEFGPAIELLNKKLVSLPAVKLYDLADYNEAFNDKSFKCGFKM